MILMSKEDWRVMAETESITNKYTPVLITLDKKQ